MKKICICGAFRLGGNPKGGQEIKTHVIADELSRAYKVKKIDTLAKYCLFKLPFQLLWALIANKHIIIMPAQNGLLAESSFLRFFNILFHKKLHYIVIGGWLPSFLVDHRWTLFSLKKFDGIYVETEQMQSSLQHLGLYNVYIIPNCKNLKIIKTPKDFRHDTLYKVCTLSRVTETKGIALAIESVIAANSVLGYNKFTLDIYGPVDEEDKAWFEELIKKYKTKDFINYKGLLPYDRTTETLSNYFAMLFPSYYPGEGFAGTIVDSMGAGLPVIASNWHNNNEIIKDGFNGIIIPPKDINALKRALLWINDNSNDWNNLRYNCISLAKNYLPENAIKPLIQNIR